MNDAATSDRKTRFFEDRLRELGWSAVGRIPIVGRAPGLESHETMWGDDGVVNVRGNGALVVNNLSLQHKLKLQKVGCQVYEERHDCILIVLPDTIGS